jgi:hypothetical protein
VETKSKTFIRFFFLFRSRPLFLFTTIKSSLIIFHDISDAHSPFICSSALFGCLRKDFFLKLKFIIMWSLKCLQASDALPLSPIVYRKKFWYEKFANLWTKFLDWYLGSGNSINVSFYERFYVLDYVRFHNPI